MKKLVLKKEVVARINEQAMHKLTGGAGTYSGTSVLVCPSDECTQVYNTCAGSRKVDETCPGYQSCNGEGTCGGYTCFATCSFITCAGLFSCEGIACAITTIY